MDSNVFHLTSGTEVHWTPTSKYLAELDHPLGEKVCRICCERENGKQNAQIGLIVSGVCSRGCLFPDDIEADRISHERFMNSEKPAETRAREEEKPQKPVKPQKPAKITPEYARLPQSPFSVNTADDRMLSVVAGFGDEGIKLGDLYNEALPFFSDKDEKSIKLVCSGFVSRFGKSNNEFGFEVVWDIAPRRGRGSNAQERRVAVVFDGQPWPSWAIAKTGVEEE
jgi:hypothetical protein